MIKTATVTGADEKTDPQELYDLWRTHKHIEVAFLYSAETGRPKYPSREWMLDTIKARPLGMPISIHLCGEPSRRFMNGDLDHIKPLLPHIKRLQVNGNPDDIKEEAFEKLWSQCFIDLIIQVKDFRYPRYFQLAKKYPNLSMLLDCSGGRGLYYGALWPAKPEGARCGWAGGLTPDNVLENLTVNQYWMGYDGWVDSETGLRSTIPNTTEHYFDLDKAKMFASQTALMVAV